MKPRIILEITMEIVLAIVILLGCGCDGDNSARADAAPPSTAPSTPIGQVAIDNFSFSPQTLTIAPGTRVTWINHDDVPHTVTSSTNHKPLSSPALDTEDKYSFIFTKPGVYEYFCAVHPHMTGKVIVK